MGPRGCSQWRKRCEISLGQWIQPFHSSLDNYWIITSTSINKELQELSPYSNEISPASVVYIGFIIKKDDNNKNDYIDVPFSFKRRFHILNSNVISSIADRSKFILLGIRQIKFYI